MTTESRGLTEGAALVDAYIASFPEPLQDRMREMGRVISDAAPDAVMKISYAMPTWHYWENLVHFACYERHIGFYPTSAGIEAFKEELSSFKFAKGSVQFPHNKPLPLDLVRRITEFRYEQARGKVHAPRA